MGVAQNVTFAMIQKSPGDSGAGPYRSRGIIPLAGFGAEPQGVAVSRIYSVREITQAIKAALAGEFPFVWVRGQVSNCSRPGSGHIYFTLKDEEAALATPVDGGE